MNIKNQLEYLVNHMTTNRQVGHTTATIHGFKKVNSVAIVHNKNAGKNFIDMCDQKNTFQGKPYLLNLRTPHERLECISIENLDSLTGNHKPIVFDNCALHTLFSDALKEIRHLEKKIERIKLLTE